ncbi:hypothetical protein [Hymenobacter siberiensis]|uniref:hypothetical protein n=1 Tax=Hymenobacter siberiensis TaxID=2848396 RepID=UPI001C1E4F81|nr:hypothetical protein [Hymenobacter siberiensis]
MYNATATQQDVNDYVIDLTSEDEHTIFFTTGGPYASVCYSRADKQAEFTDHVGEKFLADDISDELLEDVFNALFNGHSYKA